MRRHASMFIGLLMVGAIITGVIAGVVGLLSSSATIGVRAVLEATPSSSLSLGIEMPLAPDAPEQARVATRTLRAGFHDGPRAIPISIESSVETVLTAHLTSTDPGGTQSRRVRVATATNLTSDAEIVAGRWGSGPSEATLQADAAAALGVGQGDMLSIDGTDVTVVGTWRLTDVEAARWEADELWTTGTAGTVTGPLIIDPSVWSAVDAEPWVHWTIVPDVTRLHATDLSAIKDVWSEVPNDLEAAGLRTGSRSGQFLVAVQELSTRLAALQTALPLALLILATIAALTIWELAGLTSRTRATETALLWSRGGSTASLSLRAGAEAAAVSAIGSAAGAAAAAALLASTRGPDAAASALVSGGWAGAAAVAVSAIAFFLRTVRFAGPERAADRAGRARGFAGVGGVVLLLIAAALSTWQLLRYGPITMTAFNDVSVDPVTVVAPALVLASIVLLGLYAFPLLAAAAERAAIRSTGLALAVRGVSRRIGTAAATIVMIGLAVGQLMLAAGYSATWSEAFTQAQELRAGTVLRLDGPTARSIDLDLDRAAGATDVVGLAPAHTISVSVGGEEASLLGVAPSAVAALTADGAGLIDPAALSDAITPRSVSQLPAHATTVSVDVGASPAIAESIWLADAWGRLESLTLTPSPQTPGVASAELPGGGHAPWRLAGIDLAPTDDSGDAPIAVQAVTTDVGAVGPVPWALVAFRDGGAALSRDELDSQGAPRSPGALLRLLPAAAVSPVVVSESLAERIGAEAGSPITISLSQTTEPLQSVVAAIIPVIPGSQSSSGVLIDAAAIDAAALAATRSPDAPSTVWIGSSDASASARSLRELLPASVAVRELGAEPDLLMLTAGATALWIAAGAGAALAIAGFIAVCAGQQRERRHEIAVLRALGLTAGQQAGVRRGELTMLAAWGAICGAVAGTAVLLVVVATLARAAVPGAYQRIPTLPRFDFIAGGAALVAFALIVALTITIAGGVAGRHAESLTLQEAEA